MHNAAIAALGLDAVYVAARTTSRALAGLVASLLEDGGGLNITMPFKDSAAQLLHWPSDAVRASGACNTIWGDAAEPEGDNTDVGAIGSVLGDLMDGAPLGVAQLIGTGASARSAALAIAGRWPKAALHVVSRSPARAEAFVRWAGDRGLHGARSGPPAGRAQLIVSAAPYDVLAQEATRTALSSAEPPDALLDLVYPRGGSALVRAMPASRKQDGRGVLVAQGAASFRHFFGVEPPVAVMRQAVDDALG